MTLLNTSLTHYIFQKCRIVAILLFSLLGTSLSIAQITYVETNQDPTLTDGARSTAISPDGKHVYLAASNDDAIVIYSRDANSGSLSQIGSVVNNSAGDNNLDNIYSLSISPDGNHLYAAALNSDAVTAYSRNSTDGTLSQIDIEFDSDKGGVATLLNGPVHLAVAPNGNQVYVLDQNDDAIVVFDRAANGTLTFNVEYGNNTGSISNLDNPRNLCFSPNEEHLYVASQNSDAISVWNRDLSDGTLSFNEFQKDGVGSVTLLDFCRAVACTPDGNFVMVVSRVDDAITVFSRNSSTGKLTLEFEYADGTNGISNLDDPYDLVINSAGTELFVSGGNGDALISFAVNSGTGALSFNESEVDGMGDVVSGALDNPQNLVIDPTGQHIYIANFGGDQLSVFSTDNVSLPVELLSFSGELVEDQVHLGWSTANELNNDFFTLERSLDGVHFHKIGKVPAGAYPLQKQEYLFNDINLPVGATLLYYQLKQTDLDGQSAIEGILSISRKLDQPLLFQVRTVEAQQLWVDIAAPTTGPLQIYIFDAQGRLVLQQKNQVIKGDHTIPLDVGNMQSGYYIMNIQQSQQTLSKSFIKP